MTSVFLPQFRDQVRLANDGRTDSQSGIVERRLLVQVACELNRTGHPSLRQIALRSEANVIALSGEVPSFFLKQLAQATVLVVPGVARVQNYLRVSGEGTQTDVREECLS